MDNKISLPYYFVHGYLIDAFFNMWPDFSQELTAGEGMFKHSLQFNFSRLKNDPLKKLSETEISLENEDFEVESAVIEPRKTKVFFVKLPKPRNTGESSYLAVSLQKRPHVITLDLEKNADKTYLLKEWNSITESKTLNNFDYPDYTAFKLKVIEYLKNNADEGNENIVAGKSWDTKKVIDLPTSLTNLGNNSLFYLKDNFKIYTNIDDFLTALRESYSSSEEAVKKIEPLLKENSDKQNEIELEGVVGQILKERGYGLWEVIKHLIITGKAVIIDVRNNQPIAQLFYKDAGTVASPLAGSGSSNLTLPNGEILDESRWIA
jgi:hypothetical protein